jgi:CRP-like cAMP-binding protein
MATSVSIDARAELLKPVPMFASLTLDALRDVAGVARTREVEPGAIFFHEGDPASSFFVIQTGTVKLTQLTPEGHQVVLRLIGAGEAFGGVAAFSGGPYPVTAEAVTLAVVFEWPGPIMATLMERYPPIVMNALRFVAARLHELQVRYRQLATEKVERRIARALLRLVQQAGRRVESGVLVDLPLSREDIAQMTGTTLYTVSRVVSRWEGEGILEAGRQRVVITKPHALMSVAED